MSQSQRKFLRHLRDTAHRGVPASDIPSGCVGLLTELETCGAVGRRAAGRGDVVCIINRDAFELFIGRHFPLGLDALTAQAIDRVTGVQLLADAKAARRGRWEGVFVRSTKPGVELISNEGDRLPVADVTALSGGAAIALGGPRRWGFQGVVAIIENAEAFWQHERALPDIDLAVFACGRLSERVLAWLAAEELAGCDFVHWGDYDPVGCLEYLRLRERFGRRVRMHLPDRVPALLPKHGKADLITDQVAALVTLRRLNHDETVAGLVQLFDEHRKGLEQEALFIEGVDVGMAHTDASVDPHGEERIQSRVSAGLDGGVL